METATVEKTSLWHNRNFVSLWTSETISQFGSQFTQLALPLTAVIILGATAEELGILGFACSISWLLFGLLVEVYVDCHGKKRIMATSDLLRGPLLVLIPILAVLGLFTRLRIPVLDAMTLVVVVLQS